MMYKRNRVGAGMARGGTNQRCINNEGEDLPEMQLKVDECFDDLDVGESKAKRSVFEFVTNSP
jgi:hypothetical protein